MSSQTWKQPSTPVFVAEPARVGLDDVSIFLANAGDYFTEKRITLPADATYLARLLMDKFDIREKRG